jgi:hypothetical protein
MTTSDEDEEDDVISSFLTGVLSFDIYELLF